LLNVTDARVREALGYKQDGFAGMKLKGGCGIERDLNDIRIGPDWGSA